MTRIIKRYGSRKLYDSANSRYILLEDIAELVRKGEEIQVVDNKTSEDVTAQTLTQVISEEGRKKNNLLSSELLHDLIRAGETAMNNHVRQFQDGVDRFMKRSIGRLVPVRNMREEMDQLRSRLNELETSLAETEKQREAQAQASAPQTDPEPKPEAEKKPAPKRAPRKTATSTAGKTARKPAAKGSSTKAAPRKTTSRAKKQATAKAE